jgi:pteridine reductase
MKTKVVLVTGAAKRIGAQISRAFHHAGYNVILHYNQSVDDAKNLQAELDSQRPGSVSLMCLDLVKNCPWQELEDRCMQQWGRLDVLVNNASTFYPTVVGTVTDSQWEDLIGSNLKAPYFLSQALAPCLKEFAGNIVNICDIHGDRPLKNYSVYSVAKAGLAMMTRGLAKELAPEVRVNGIAPGAILWPEQQAEVKDSTKATIIRQIPLKRQGAPEDVANTAVFLARDAPYINGQILSVDGGRSLS